MGVPNAAFWLQRQTGANFVVGVERAVGARRLERRVRQAEMRTGQQHLQ